LEVDFVLGRGEVAIEAKGASRIDSSDVRPIKAFLQAYRPARAFVVCNEQRSRVHEGVHIIPWREFLEMLWNGAVIS
jgi:predicted AAA+ superfamily ATPase